MKQMQGLQGGRFKITDAVTKGYNFTMREAGYLCKIALVPFALSLATSFYLQFALPDASAIESFLWNLPSATAFSWFLFVEARLVFLGERIDRMTKQEMMSFSRQRAMRLSVIMWLLFGMGMTAGGTFLIWAAGFNAEAKSTPLSISIMFSIGAMFWALRLGFAPLLASIDGSVRKFLFIVNGMSFSLRIIGLLFLCFLPVMFVGHAVLSMLVKDYFTAPEKLGQNEIFIIIIVLEIISMIALTILTAAACYALREVLETEERKKRL